MVDDRNPRCAAREGDVDADRLALDADIAAGIGPVGTREHLHQGGFARPVLPHQRMDLAGVGDELDIAQRLHPEESLRHFAHMEDRFAHRHLSSSLALKTVFEGPRTAHPAITTKRDRQGNHPLRDATLPDPALADPRKEKRERSLFELRRVRTGPRRLVEIRATAPCRASGTAAVARHRPASTRRRAR